MTETNEPPRPDFLQGALYGVEGSLANLATAVTQVKIDIDSRRRTSPTGQGLDPVPAAKAEGFREGLQWALNLLDAHIPTTVLHAGLDEARQAGERAAAARAAARRS